MAVRDAAISVAKSGNDPLVRIPSRPSVGPDLRCNVARSGRSPSTPSRCRVLESRRMQTSVIVVWGPVGAGISTRGEHTFRARPGHHLSPALLSSGRNVFEQLGPGYTLIALANQPRPAAAFRAAARALGIPLRVLADTFAGPRTAYQSRLILVRPDQYVAWTGDDLPADPAAVLRRVVGGQRAKVAEPI